MTRRDHGAALGPTAVAVLSENIGDGGNTTLGLVRGKLMATKPDAAVLITGVSTATTGPAPSIPIPSRSDGLSLREERERISLRLASGASGLLARDWSELKDMLAEDTLALDFLVSDGYGERTLKVEAGRTLLKSLQDASVAVGSVCGGQMACGTCHVFLEPRAGVRQEEPGSDETTLLEYSRHYRPGQSRLACQVEVTPALAGARIVIAPDE